MSDDEQRVIPIEEARRRRRAREAQAGGAGDERPGAGEVRISDAMSHLLEKDPDAAEGPSAAHLRLIVEREFGGEQDDDPPT